MLTCAGLLMQLPAQSMAIRSLRSQRCSDCGEFAGGTGPCNDGAAVEIACWRGHWLTSSPHPQALLRCRRCITGPHLALQSPNMKPCTPTVAPSRLDGCDVPRLRTANGDSCGMLGMKAPSDAEPARLHRSTNKRLNSHQSAPTLNVLTGGEGQLLSGHSTEHESC